MGCRASRSIGGRDWGVEEGGYMGRGIVEGGVAGE